MFYVEGFFECMLWHDLMMVQLPQQKKKLYQCVATYIRIWGHLLMCLSTSCFICYALFFALFPFAPLWTSHLSQSWWTETERAHILVSLSHPLWVSFNLCVSCCSAYFCSMCGFWLVRARICILWIFLFFFLQTTRTMPRVWLTYVFMRVKVVEAASALMCINVCVN